MKTRLVYAGTTRPLGKTQNDAAPLFLFGKRGHQALIAASSPGDSARSRVLFIHERNSGKRFMIDSGADVSAIPPTHADRQRPNSGITLQAVNQTSIKTYGQRLLNLGLRRSFSHIFIVADIPHPIFSKDSIFPSASADDALLMTRSVYQ